MTEERRSVSLYHSLKMGRGFLYGIWPENQKDLSLEKAQEGLLSLLMEFLPSPPARILVVGCGPGWPAFEMAQKGYRVTAIDSSPEFIEEAVQKYGTQSIDFFVLDFAEGDISTLPGEYYDVLFIHEFSFQQDSLESCLNRTRRLLKQQGMLIISDEVCYDNSVIRSDSIKAPADYVVSLSEQGFCITKREAVGEKVKFTSEILLDTLRYGLKASSDSMDMEKARDLIDFWDQRKNYWETGKLGFEVFAAQKDRFFLRAYNEGDEEQILSLFRDCFHTDRTPEHWKWKFRDNPYGSLKIALAVDEKGTIAAHYAGYPVPFYLSKGGDREPEVMIGYQNGDSMTRPCYRNIGLGRTSLFSRVFHYFIAKFSEERLSFYYGFNTGKTKIFGERYLGYNYIRPVTFWGRDLTRTPLKRPKPVARILSGIKTEETHQTSREWDEFFERAAPFYKLLVHRNSAYLQWRYLSCPDKVHRMFRVRKKGRLIGWGVFRQEDKKLVWGDALFDRGCLKYLEGFLFDTVSRFYPTVEVIEAWFTLHPTEWGRRLRELGFTLGPEPLGLTPCAQNNWRNNPGKSSVLEREEEIFYYTKGDSDLF